jgi:hypothetical protein
MSLSHVSVGVNDMTGALKLYTPMLEAVVSLRFASRLR